MCSRIRLKYIYQCLLLTLNRPFVRNYSIQNVSHEIVDGLNFEYFEKLFYLVLANLPNVLQFQTIVHRTKIYC